MSRSGTGKKLKFKKKKNTKNKSRNTIITSSPPHPGQQQRSGKAKKHFSTFFSLGSLINRMRYQKAPKEQEQKQKNIDRPFCDTSKNQALRRQTHTHTHTLSLNLPTTLSNPRPAQRGKTTPFCFFCFLFFCFVCWAITAFLRGHDRHTTSAEPRHTTHNRHRHTGVLDFLFRTCR